MCISTESQSVPAEPSLSDAWAAFRETTAQLAPLPPPQAQTHEQNVARITDRAMTALTVIATAIDQHPGTGQVGRLVRFVAGCYNGTDYPFDLANLRALDTRLANACLDYLNYDRLGVREIHYHLPGGERALHRWLRDYGVLPATGSHD